MIIVTQTGELKKCLVQRDVNYILIIRHVSLKTLGDIAAYVSGARGFKLVDIKVGSAADSI